ncbi:glycosyltransferase [Serratia liquefaciens]|uniref:glycosyltransferase n=1 Tax=Serratia liquefaciens TaxID=614 RepID=UPI00165CFC05|nr:glycosyltransferase [Serratia liquefaciens]QNQ55932.1 glycosyltransferase [Serratia liquefaciens]
MSDSQYNDSFYANQIDGSYLAAKKILEYIRQYHDFKSAVDIGSGLCAWLKVCQELGADKLLGLDGDYVNRDNLLIDDRYFKSCDLERDDISINDKFDIAISLEVIEHLSESRGIYLINKLCSLSDVVLFSGAIPFQGGTEHISEQWPQKWAIEFINNGFVPIDLIRPRFWNDNSLPWWYRQNIFVYAKKGSALEENESLRPALSMPMAAVHPELYLLANTKQEKVESTIADFYLSGLLNQENMLKNSGYMDVSQFSNKYDACLKRTTEAIEFPFSHNYEHSKESDKCVSIIMRTQNRPILFSRAIASVVEQTYQNWYLYVINDGGDPDIVNESIRPFDTLLQGRITVVHNPKALGMEAASDKAAEKITSEFAVVHDDDDSWHPDFLKECVSFLTDKENKAYGGVVTHTTLIRELLTDNSIRFIEEMDFNCWYNEIDIYRLLGENTFAPISFVFRSELFSQVGLFNRDLPVLGDWDFNIRALLVADIAVLPKKLAYYHHRVQTENSSYGNSVTQGLNKHQRFNILYRNALLRKSLEDAPWQAGILLNDAKNNHDLNKRITDLEHQLREIKELNGLVLSDVHELLHYHMGFKKEHIEISKNTYSLVLRIFSVLSKMARPVIFIKRKVFRVK